MGECAVEDCGVKRCGVLCEVWGVLCTVCGVVRDVARGIVL